MANFSVADQTSNAATQATISGNFLIILLIFIIYIVMLYIIESHILVNCCCCLCCFWCWCLLCITMEYIPTIAAWVKRCVRRQQVLLNYIFSKVLDKYIFDRILITFAILGFWQHWRLIPTICNNIISLTEPRANGSFLYCSCVYDLDGIKYTEYTYSKNYLDGF